MGALRCTYPLVPEGVDQAGALLHGEREGEVGPRVDLWDIDVLVAEETLPLGVPAHLVLPEEVRDQVP